MTDEQIKRTPWFALEKYSDKLTPEQLDYCIHEMPLTALKHCSDKLTPEQIEYCILRGAGAAAALLFCPEKLTEEQFNFCVHKDPWAAREYCADKLTDDLTPGVICILEEGELVENCT